MVSVLMMKIYFGPLGFFSAREKILLTCVDTIEYGKVVLATYIPCFPENHP
jgi:hypothetical protein